MECSVFRGTPCDLIQAHEQKDSSKASRRLPSPPDSSGEILREQVVGWLVKSDEEDVLWVLRRIERMEEILQRMVALNPALMQRLSPARENSQQPSPEAVTGGGVGGGLCPQCGGKLAEEAESPCAVPVRARSSFNHRTSTKEATESTFEPIKDFPIPAESKDGPRPATADPIIQFSSSIYYSCEGVDSVELDILRIGRQDVRSVVKYSTADGSAKADFNYKPQAGTLTFQPGEDSKSVTVPLCSNDAWDTTTEFNVELDTHGLVRAELGRNLWQARVMIIDDDAFPTNRYKDEIKGQKLHLVPKTQLLFEFFKMNLARPGLMRNTLKMMMVDQTKNMHFILNLFLDVYLVDNVLGTKGLWQPVSSYTVALILILAAKVLPVIVLHWLDYRQLTWGVGGNSRMTIQKALVRKFLNYDPHSRAQVDQGDVVMAVTRDTVCLVQEGYMNIIALVAALGKLVIIFTYQVLAPVILGKNRRVIMLTPFFLFPMFQISFLVFRRRTITSYLEKTHHEEDKIVDCINQPVNNFQLIADYNKRGLFVDAFEDCVKKYNVNFVVISQALQNNKYFSTWLSTLFVSVYTFVAGLQLIADREVSTVGQFLADLTILMEIGLCWQNIYHILVEMQVALPAMIRLTRLLNLPTDIPNRMRLATFHQEETERLREQLAHKERQSPDLERPSRLDLLPIRVCDVAFELGPSKTVRLMSEMQCRQGELCAIVGRRGAGKSTMLRIIGGAVLPVLSQDRGEVFYIPSHLRVLHVSQGSLFFFGTLFENLTFGVRRAVGGQSSDGDMERVLDICRRLRVPADTIEMIRSSTEKHPSWGDSLSQSVSSALCIARALIANPEILILHKPSLAFDEVTSDLVLKVLKEFVDLKGVCQDPSLWYMRRPRTCLYSTMELADLIYADLVYHICPTTGMKNYKSDEITEEMLA